MAMGPGQINRYDCQRCGGHIVTQDKVEGTTPFMLPCYATKGCTGTMFSACYRVPQTLLPDYEWVSPSPSELDAFCILAMDEKRLTRSDDELLFMAKAIRDHAQRGGLFLSKAGALVV